MEIAYDLPQTLPQYPPVAGSSTSFLQEEEEEDVEEVEDDGESHRRQTPYLIDRLA
jgi:hypothetical protein